jgi:hypothetical protein
MLRPRRDIQLPSRKREPSPPRLSKINSQPKRRRIDTENVDRNDVDQALAVIAAAPECSDELPTLILTELPQFTANYIQNWPGYSQYTTLSEAGFLSSSLAMLSSKSSRKKQTHTPNSIFKTLLSPFRQLVTEYLLRLAKYVCT